MLTGDERAYQAALASWRHFAEINEEVGLPPLGNEPQREDFVGFTKAQQDAAVAQAAARQDAEARWQQRLEELKPYIREVVPIGERPPDDARSQIARKEQEGLRRFADRAWANRDAVQANLEAIARKHGVPVVRQRDDGRFEQIADELGGYPVWITSHNQIAAAGTSADELWPTNSAPWPSSSTGKNLTGSNVVLGVWEVGGTVKTNHMEFGARVLQIDADSTNLSDHATGVVGTMAAHGEGVSLPSIPTGSIARGVAFDAYIDAYIFRAAKNYSYCNNYSFLFATLPEPVRWLDDSRTALFSCVLPMLWAGMGPGCLIYLAALKGIPDDLYEAADLDGASFTDKILFVVVPTLRPLLIINFVGVFIASWQAEANILAMTAGGARTEVAGLHIFYKAFIFLRLGPATAAAWMLGCLLVGFTLTQLRILSRVEFRANREEK